MKKKSKLLKLWCIVRTIIGTPIILIGAWFVFLGTYIKYGKESANDTTLSIFPTLY